MKKQCARCGKVHTKIPDNARIMNVGDPFDGAYWECDCLSTLFVKKGRTYENNDDNDGNSKWLRHDNE